MFGFRWPQHSYFFEGSKAVDDPAFDGMILMWGRLAPGVTTSQAEQELLALTNQLRKVYPAMIWDKEWIVVSPGAQFFSLEDGAPLLGMAAILVLLILGVACANLGGLLMARGVSRQREIQLRIDLGRAAVAGVPAVAYGERVAWLSGFGCSAAAELRGASPGAGVCGCAGMDERFARLAGIAVYRGDGVCCGALFWAAAGAATEPWQETEDSVAASGGLRAGGCELRVADPRGIAGAGDAAYDVLRSGLWV